MAFNTGSANSKPESSAPLHGFENAPFSRFLLIASGAATFGVMCLPRHHHSLLHLSWPLVTSKKQIWRFVTSQFVYSSTINLLYGSALIYYFRILERRWGSTKYASFVFITYTFSTGLNWLCYYTRVLESYILITDTVANGLYGPLFALLIYYFKDVPSGVSGSLGPSITGKILVYFIAIKMLLSSDSAFMASICGITSGILYKYNFLNVQKWLLIPKPIANAFKNMFNWFGRTKKQCHKRTCMGATEDIQEDMVYDSMLKRQIERQGRARTRQQRGQGYADVLQPAVNPFQALFGGRNDDFENIELPTDPAPQNSSSSDREEITEEKIQRLVEMGFTREAVIGALATADNNIEDATNILLSQ